MKKLVKAIAAIILMTMVVLPVGCKKTEQEHESVKVETSQVTDLTNTTATASGMVLSVGVGVSAIECGACWCKAANSDHEPEVADYHMSAGAVVLGSFTCNITGLLPQTEYLLRAYALYNDGVTTYATYGRVVKFTTLADNGNGGGNSGGGNGGGGNGGGNSGGGSGSGNGSYGGHDYIDLGLPSGTLWATCNLGATTPEDYGGYYAWGETTTKTTYNWSTYKYCNGNDDLLTKYCCNSDYGYNGFADNLDILQPSDDAATANWGDGWRMPVLTQWGELYRNTTSTWTTQNGVSGRLFTASNGNSLFLPAAGYRKDDELDSVGSIGNYWSSSLDGEIANSAWGLYVVSEYNFLFDYFRSCGRSVRAVRSSRQN